MNSNLRQARQEMKKLKKNPVYDSELVNVVLDFSRPGKEPKKMKLTVIRVSRQLAERICNRRERQEVNID